MISEVNLDRSRLVQEYFHTEAFFWKDVYTQDSLNGAIYRERRAGVLGFVDALKLPSEARALDVGCGAGTTSVALAQRGLQVNAVDAVPDMVGLTKQAAGSNDVGDRVSVRMGDVHNLPFNDQTFDLAIAVGVMEWMPAYERPLRELHRVLRPGGWLIANVDNAHALHCLIDPRMTPLASPVKRFTRRMAERIGCITPMARPTRCSRTRFDRAIHDAGFNKVGSRTSGFGPMTLMGMHLMPERVGVGLHNVLQDFADRQFPLIRNGGETYLVLAQKSVGERQGVRLEQV